MSGGPDSQLDVVLLHGLDGDFRSTWTYKESGIFWPEWLSVNLPDVAVWSVDYDAWSTHWRGQSMPMQDRAINLIELLESSGVGERPVVLIGHSMGGLIIKQILFHATAVASTPGPLSQAIAGVAYLATPHTGSGIAQLVNAIRVAYRPTVAVRDLEDNQAYLRMLNTWYRNRMQTEGIPNLVFYETQRLHGVFIVDAASADPGIPGVSPIPVDATHRSISKVESEQDLVYLRIRRFISEIITNAGTTAAPTGTSDDVSARGEDTTDNKFDAGAISGRLASTGIFDSAHSWLIEDQIKDSGGWGVGQARLLEQFNEVPSTALERREGGIISTFVSLTALRNYEGDARIFQSRDYAWSAARYLLQRQTAEGGFGRFIESRSGVELHPSVRHTAFAVSALLDLDTSSEAAFAGIKYIEARIRASPETWWQTDAAPSLAASGVLHLQQQITLLGSNYFESDPDIELLDAEAARHVRRGLAAQATIGESAPLWRPYGGQHEMVYDTALTTIDLLPRPTPRSLRSVVQRAITSILAREIDGGIPYGPADNEPDVGMSALMLHILCSRLLTEPGSETADPLHKYEEHAHRLTDFLITAWPDERYWRKTYADTLAYVLRLVS